MAMVSVYGPLHCLVNRGRNNPHVGIGAGGNLKVEGHEFQRKAP